MYIHDVMRVIMRAYARVKVPIAGRGREPAQGGLENKITERLVGKLEASPHLKKWMTAKP